MPLPSAPVPPAPAALTAWTTGALAQLPAAVVITTAELNAPGPQIVACNAAFCALTGYAESELLGQTPRILQGPETDRATLDRMRAAATAGESFLGRVVNYRKSGERYVIEWSLSPLRDAHGTTTHFIAVQREISLQQQNQEMALEALAQHVAALTEAVLVLEKTKRNFRSTELAALRRRLSDVLRLTSTPRADGPAGPPLAR